MNWVCFRFIDFQLTEAAAEIVSNLKANAIKMHSDPDKVMQITPLGLSLFLGFVCGGFSGLTFSASVRVARCFNSLCDCPQWRFSSPSRPTLTQMGLAKLSFVASMSVPLLFLTQFKLNSSQTLRSIIMISVFLANVLGLGTRQFHHILRVIF